MHEINFKGAKIIHDWLLGIERYSCGRQLTAYGNY